MTTPAFIQLITSHQSRLYGYILSLVFDRSEADDLLQQTNMVLWRKANEFEMDTNFVAWAFRIAYYEVMQYRRKKQRERLVFDDDLVSGIAKVAQEEDEHFVERHKALRVCLDQLSGRHRDVVRRRYLLGTDLARIAGEVGSTVNAVKQMLFRAREALRACMDGKLEAES